MSDPKRWIDGEGPGRLLVASMQGESLSAEAKLRLRSSLGIGVGAGTVALAAKEGAARAAVATKSAKLVVAKWLGVAALGGAVLGGAGVLAQTFAGEAVPPVATARPSSAPGAASTLSTASMPPGPDPGEDVAPASPPPDEPAGDPREESEVSPVAPQRTHARPPATAKPEARASDTGRGDLTEELRLLEVARRALRAGDAAGALVGLEHYRASGSHGVLAIEAEALEVEALVASGRASEAVAKGRRFLARNGEGPLSDRVRRLIAAEQQ